MKLFNADCRRNKFNYDNFRQIGELCCFMSSNSNNTHAIMVKQFLSSCTLSFTGSLVTLLWTLAYYLVVAVVLFCFGYILEVIQVECLFRHMFNGHYVEMNYNT